MGVPSARGLQRVNMPDRNREENGRAELMHESEAEWHLRDQRPDAEGDLEPDGCAQREGRHPRGVGRRWRAHDACDVPCGKAREHIGDEPVVELHRHRVLEQVDVPGLGDEEAARHDLSVHERPRVVGETCLHAGDERAEFDLEEGEPEQKHAAAGAIRCGPRLPILVELQRRPDQRTEDDEGEPQVQRQPVLRDGHALR